VVGGDDNYDCSSLVVGSRVQAPFKLQGAETDPARWYRGYIRNILKKANGVFMQVMFDDGEILDYEQNDLDLRHDPALETDVPWMWSVIHSLLCTALDSWPTGPSLRALSLTIISQQSDSGSSLTETTAHVFSKRHVHNRIPWKKQLHDVAWEIRNQTVSWDNMQALVAQITQAMVACTSDATVTNCYSGSAWIMLRRLLCVSEAGFSSGTMDQALQEAKRLRARFHQMFYFHQMFKWDSPNVLLGILTIIFF